MGALPCVTVPTAMTAKDTGCPAKIWEKASRQRWELALSVAAGSCLTLEQNLEIQNIPHLSL